MIRWTLATLLVVLGTGCYRGSLSVDTRGTFGDDGAPADNETTTVRVPQSDVETLKRVDSRLDGLEDRLEKLEKRYRDATRDMLDKRDDYEKKRREMIEEKERYEKLRKEYERKLKDL
ncbi:MAG: hypothetical protein ACOCXX_05250 [Planctomycetota bacterium]